METVRTTDGSLTLLSARYGEGYRSRHGALSESRHVFLGASGVLERLAVGDDVAVLEVGFGSGLNFLVTACAAIASRRPAPPARPARLAYTALENDPPPLSALRALDYAGLLAPCTVPVDLLDWLGALGQRPPAGSHRLRLPGAAAIELELVVGDALAFTPAGAGYDAVYLDPFSPKANPALWAADFLTGLARALKPGGRLVTYSVSGEARRRLADAGLDVSKVAGPPGGKREALVAEKPRA